MALESNRSLEIKVGLFFLIGFSLLGGLAVTFGRFGETVEPRISLTIEFPNASGLLQGSSVLMAGAKIGRVTSPPKVLPEGRGVAIEVSVLESVPVPVGSEFRIGSSGLLGDRFVDVRPPKGQAEAFLQSGSVAIGKRESGMDDLTREGTDLVEELRGVVAKLDKLFTKLDTEVLDDESTANLRATFANLKAASDGFAEASRGFAEASGKFTEVMEEVRSMVADLKASAAGIDPVLEKAGGVMDDASRTVQKIGLATEDVRRSLAQLDGLLEKLGSEEGTLGALMQDGTLREDLQSLITNLRRHGVLFYRDSSGENDGDAPKPIFRPGQGHRGPR